MKKPYSALCLLALSAPLAAAPLSDRFREVKVRHCPSAQVCHTQEAAYPLSGHAALDRWAAGVLQQNINARSLRPNALKAALSQKTENDTSCEQTYVNEIKLLGQSNHYAVFGEEDWEYTCGAHGNGTYRLYVLPQSGAAQALPLAQIVLPGKMAELEKLQLAAWRQYLTQASNFAPEGFTPAEIDAHLAQWPVAGTHNWQLAENGLVFLFQTYEIGPYAMGRPELRIGREQLQGIIKPEILRETATFRPSRHARD
ncbi:MAG: RsiV family protein [Eikenella sp.]|nr:RsiV family protein [Eikenella sp.]